MVDYRGSGRLRNAVPALPNAFTPNGDGLNDQFTGIAHCPVDRYHWWCLTDSGKVFESFNPADRWDGTWRANRSPAAPMYMPANTRISC